jgi:zinc transport system permease protein
MLVGVVLVWIFFFNRFFLTFLNRPLAKSRGIDVWFVEGLFAAIVALVVTVSIPWIGLLVINSLLILPAAAARNLSRSMAQYHAFAIVISLVSGILGLIGSFYWNTASGATIVIFAMAFFAVSLVSRRR